MKKILTGLFVAAIAVLGFSSCQDDNDLPNVDYQITISGAVESEGTIYVVKGDAVTFESINVINNEVDKRAMITSATYYWDYYRLGTTYVEPFGYPIQTTEATQVGEHQIAIESPLYAVDKSIATSVVAFPVQVVETAEDLPADGVTAFTLTPSYKDDNDD